MKVYVESGFALTLALQQDDYRSAEAILALAHQGRITLALPALSLSEPFATVQYRANSRHRLLGEMRREARELGRTRPHQRVASELDVIAIEMDQVLPRQLNSLESVVQELGRACTFLEIDGGVISRAAVYRGEHELLLQDAIILASIILDREHDPSQEGLFISQNTTDFQRPSVGGALGQANCKYLADFANAVRYITRPSGSG